MEPLLVPAYVTETLVAIELNKARSDYGHLFNISNLSNGRLFVAIMKSLPIELDDNTFIFIFDCLNYKLWPPLIRMVDPASEDINNPEPVEIDTFNAYPQCPSDGLFNKYNSRPVICKEFNRGAYDLYKGIHENNWKLPLEATCEFDWTAQNSALDNLSAILYYLWKKLNQPDFCKGRMKP
jgi:hypothetical protein